MLSYKNIFENYKIFFNLFGNRHQTDARDLITVHRKYFMAHLSKYFYDTYIKYEIIQQNMQHNMIRIN